MHLPCGKRGPKLAPLSNEIQDKKPRRRKMPQKNPPTPRYAMLHDTLLRRKKKVVQELVKDKIESKKSHVPINSATNRKMP